MFQFRGFATGSTRLQHVRLPHSDTRGSRFVCNSPRIFAAYRVLRRLREPRHPPCALGSLPILHRSFSETMLALARLIYHIYYMNMNAFQRPLSLLSIPLPALSMNFLSHFILYKIKRKIVDHTGVEPVKCHIIMTPSPQRALPLFILFYHSLPRSGPQR